MSFNSSPEGRILYKNWKVGRKIGEGAQASVHVLVDATTGNNTGLVAKIAKFPDPNLSKKKSAEIMVNVRILSLEKDIYRNYFNAGDVVPALSEKHLQHPSYLSGKIGNEYQYLVQEQMEKTLFGGIKEMIDSSGSTTSVNLAEIAQKLFHNCEAVHLKNHIMVDVKPDNIMFAQSSDQCQSLAERLRFVDLGLWKRYTADSANGAKVAALTGNAMYCSLHMQELENPVFRDDVQMMAIVLGEIVIRTQAILNNTTNQYEKTKIPSYLPWSQGKNDKEVFRMKKDNLLTSTSEFYKRMPTKAAKILFDLIQLTQNTSSRSKPDYKSYNRLLKELVIPKPAKRKTAKTASRRVPGVAAARTSSASLQEEEEGSATRRNTRSNRSTRAASRSTEQQQDGDDDDSKPSPRKRAAVSNHHVGGYAEGGPEPMDVDEIFDPFANEQENVATQRNHAAKSSNNKAGILLVFKRGGDELQTLSAFPGVVYSIGSKKAKDTKNKSFIQVPGILPSHCEFKVNGVPARAKKLLSVDFKHVAKNGTSKVGNEVLDPENPSKLLEIAEVPTAKQTAKKLRLGDVVVEFKQLF